MLALLKLVNSQQHIKIVCIILYVERVHVSLKDFGHIVGVFRPLLMSIRGRIDRDFAGFVFGKRRKRLKHGDFSGVVPIPVPEVLDDGPGRKMKGKPILFADGEKAIAKVPVISLGFSEHIFFEQSEFEIKARLPLIIFFGVGIERWHEHDSLGQRGCVDRA